MNDNPYRTARLATGSIRKKVSGRRLVLAFVAVGVVVMSLMIALCAPSLGF